MMQSIKGALQPCSESPQTPHLPLNSLDWPNNDSVLCIAVEYVKNDYKLPETDMHSSAAQHAQVYTQFDNNLSILDPHIEAISRYSPMYTETAAKFCTPTQSGVVVKQVVTNSTIHDNGNNHHQEHTELSPSDFLQMVDTSHSVVQNIQMMPHQSDQDVDILITDQATGISYLVERCLNDSQLLDTDVLLDSDLLALDENVLKSTLTENIVESSLDSDILKTKETEVIINNEQEFVEQEEDLVLAVQQICDRPIQTRARASLPVSHLVINKNQRGDESVFAKKFIPCRTKFGPIEGVLLMDQVKCELDQLHLSIDTNGVLQQLDVSNENLCNWMGFVQLATKHSDQNLVLFQQDNQLYFLTTKNINAKQELLVGYSPSYAQRRNLMVLEPEIDEEDLWPCYECPQKCLTSEELQKHLEKHDERVPARKTTPMLNDLSQTNQDSSSNATKNEKRVQKSTTQDVKKKDEYKCPKCYKGFATSDRIQRHMMVHGDEATKPLQCDKCQKRFLNSSALSCHLKTHLFGAKVYECPICKESFENILQLKCHVTKHSVDGKFTCPFCKKVFIKYSIIRKHIRAFHCEKVHECPDCDKAFPTLDKLRMHTLKHSDHREFLCADCGKQFKRKDKLREHCKKVHNEDGEEKHDRKVKTEPTDYHRFIYKCHSCLLGFKRRGMLVNHLAKRHPDVSPDTVPELNLPIYRITKDYYCNYCEKIYKSSSKRKAHILKNHPGLELPMGHRAADTTNKNLDLPNPTFSQTVGSFTTRPQACCWCHRQYASKAKLLQHQRKKHSEMMDLENLRKNFGKGNGMDDDNILSDVCDVGVPDDGYYHLISLANGVNHHETEHNEDISTDERLYGLVNIENGLVPPR